MMTDWKLSLLVFLCQCMMVLSTIKCVKKSSGCGCDLSNNKKSIDFSPMIKEGKQM